MEKKLLQKRPKTLQKKEPLRLLEFTSQSSDKKAIEDQIMIMVSLGLDADIIAQILKVTQKELEEKHRLILENGQQLANYKVAMRLYDMAINGKGRESTLAVFFWLKARAGWVETQQYRFDSKGSKDSGGQEKLPISVLRDMMKRDAG